MTFRLTDFTFSAHTLSPILEQQVRELGRAFETSLEIGGVLSLSSSERQQDRWVPLAELEVLDTSKLANIVFVDPQKALVSLTIDLPAIATPVRQNLVTLRLSKEYLARTDHLDRLRSWIFSLCCIVEPTFGFGYESDASKFDFRAHPSLGISAGLPDFYLVNLFGPPFTAIIPNERLDAVCATKREKVSGGSYCIFAVDNLLEYDAQQFRHLAQTARICLGEQFFDLRPPLSVEESKSLRRSFAQALFGRASTGWKPAEVRPQFERHGA